MTGVLEGVFRTLLEMSMTAAAAAIVVMLVRLALSRAPKAISGMLWFVVLFRLLCPVSFKSAVSLFTLRETASSLVLEQMPVMSGTADVPTAAVSPDGLAPAVVSPAASAPQTLSVMAVLAIIWAAVALGLMAYGVVSYLKTKRSVKTATLVEGSIYESDTITSPFVAGFIRPKIYLPVSLENGERDYIILHEKTHIKRRDYLVKPVWFIASCLHWFNPVVWASYFLVACDIEMSCDEAVVRKMGDGVRADYSSSLLALSAPRTLITGSPLAFGESHTFSRIKNVLNFKKPVFWVVILAVLAAAATIFILASDPAEKLEMSTADKYLQYKTEYIGDNAKVGGIISLMEFPEDISVDHFELQTEAKPYGVTIYLNTDRTLPEALGFEEELSIYVHNSAILFVLVGNADTVDFKLIADNGRQATFSYTREETNALYGFDVRSYSESSEKFQALLTANTVFKHDLDGEAAGIIERNLTVIMSSPAYSSAPGDYIDAHREEYEAILKLGQPALDYMLSCFENGEGNTLKGHIMKLLCQELLGPENSFSDEALLPSEWYEKIQDFEETELPDYVYTGDDPILKLVYETETAEHQGWGSGFTVAAPQVFGSYEEDGYLKVFVTTFYASYHLYGRTVDMYTAGVVPAAITYKLNADGAYALEAYEHAKEGSLFAPSIRDYCTMPVSGETIPGLADEIINDYGKDNGLKELQNSNLTELLEANGITDAVLTD